MDVISDNLQLEYNDDGQNQESEAAGEIWDNLLENCNTYEEKLIIKKIRDLNIENIAKPTYQQSVKILATNEKIYTDLIWKDEKVMLFLEENKSSYDVAKKTGWHCYCTSEIFDIDEFLERIKE